ncbi:MAG: VanZ family protein [Lachnospiraceae bacterium]|nr:VanZ family protein [Lachnospiraceae bacterium]
MLRNTTRNQKLGWVLFVAYLTLLVYFVFFAESFGRLPEQRDDYAYNLELFKEIKRFYCYREQLGMKAFLLNVVGNVVAFIPCGFFLPIISRRGRRWYNTILLGFGLSLCIELVQLVFKVGSFDVDDLLLNTLGGAVGYVGNRLVQLVRVRRKKLGKKKT